MSHFNPTQIYRIFRKTERWITEVGSKWLVQEGGKFFPTPYMTTKTTRKLHTLAKLFHGENKPKGQILNISNNI